MGDPAGDFEVALGQAADGVGRQDQRDRVPEDVDVRVVVHVLSVLAHLVHEGQRGAEVVELVRRGNRRLVDLSAMPVGTLEGAA